MAEDSQPSIFFGDLSSDENLKKVVTALHISTDEIKSHLEKACSDEYYKSSPEDRLEYDLLFAYSINALFWMYLRTTGTDPSEHDLKGELARVQTLSKRVKQVKERKTMPHLDVDAAKRFVRSGLWQPKSKEEEDGEPKRKHLRFDDSDEKKDSER